MNNKILLTIILFIGFTAFTYTQKIELKEKKGGGILQFNRTTHNFGKITEGDTVRTVFVYKNTGTDSLAVVVRGSGCLGYGPLKPLAPGESAEVNVIFNSKGKNGVFTKSLAVTHDGQGTVIYLVIKGIVQKKVQPELKKGH